ncbi:hypothetical protein BC827DRAFT_1227106 [Russula dissimulans]|nr:hypothetical protein BC827DRAFT_1227106 [Russula dissimulans]
MTEEQHLCLGVGMRPEVMQPALISFGAAFPCLCSNCPPYIFFPYSSIPFLPPYHHDNHPRYSCSHPRIPSWPTITTYFLSRPTSRTWALLR